MFKLSGLVKMFCDRANKSSTIPDYTSVVKEGARDGHEYRTGGKDWVTWRVRVLERVKYDRDEGDKLFVALFLEGIWLLTIGNGK